MCAFQTMFGIVLIADSLNSVWEIRFKIYPFEDTVNISTPIHWIYINTYKPAKKEDPESGLYSHSPDQISMRITGLEQYRVSE